MPDQLKYPLPRNMTVETSPGKYITSPWTPEALALAVSGGGWTNGTQNLVPKPLKGELA